MHTCAYPSHPRKFTYFVSGEKRQTGVAASGFQHNNTITVKYDRTTSQANVRKIIETRKKKTIPRRFYSSGPCRRPLSLPVHEKTIDGGFSFLRVLGIAV